MATNQVLLALFATGPPPAPRPRQALPGLAAMTAIAALITALRAVSTAPSGRLERIR